MNVRLSDDDCLEVRADAIVVPVFSDLKLDGAAAALDGALSGAIGELLQSGEIAGKTNETMLVHASGKTFKRVLVVGLGDRKTFKPYGLGRYAGAAVRYLGKRNMRELVIALPPEAAEDAALAASFVAEGALAATIDTTIYRSEPDKPVVTETLSILVGPLDRSALERGIARGIVLGEAVNTARTMALTPANDMTPTHMAEQAKKLAAEFGLKYDALDEEQMHAKGMGAILGVSAGSEQPAKMIVLRYDGGGSETIGLVGKGVTFDSGGISIKPAEAMHEMKYDMSGGAGVIAAMTAIARLKPKLNVIGIIPASENLPGGRAVKPGDILRAMNGKTIEVINTDAEGRLLLADGLCYARELGATKLVDCATLTGACVVALGHAASGTMSNDDAFVTSFLDVANETGERYWRLPLFEDYAQAMKSEIADLKNTGGRPAGSETAGAFLQAFVGETPWIHLDIAGTAYLDKESAYSAKGPTGTPVRALVTFVEALANGHANGAHTNGSAKAQPVATTA